jgi:HKD family nuclease
MSKFPASTNYELSHLQMVRKMCKDKPDPIVNALRSAINNGKQLTFEVIQWITNKKDLLLKTLVDTNNISWLQTMLLSWKKIQSS